MAARPDRATRQAEGHVTSSDRERQRLEKLEAMKAENHIRIEAAQREERSGPAAARREEWARRTAWKVEK